MSWYLLHQLTIKKMPDRHATGQTDQASSSAEVSVPQVTRFKSNWQLKINIWLSLIKFILKYFASVN